MPHHARRPADFFTVHAQSQTWTQRVGAAGGLSIIRDCVAQNGPRTPNLQNCLPHLFPSQNQCSVVANSFVLFEERGSVSSTYYYTIISLIGLPSVRVNDFWYNNTALLVLVGQSHSIAKLKATADWVLLRSSLFSPFFWCLTRTRQSSV